MTDTPSSLCLQRRWLWPSLLRRVEPTTTPQSAQGRERSQFSRRMILHSIPVSLIPVIHEIMDPSLYHLVQYLAPVSVDLISNLASRTVHCLYTLYNSDRTRRTRLYPMFLPCFSFRTVFTTAHVLDLNVCRENICFSCAGTNGVPSLPCRFLLSFYRRSL